MLRCVSMEYSSCGDCYAARVPVQEQPGYESVFVPGPRLLKAIHVYLVYYADQLLESSILSLLIPQSN